MLFTIFIYLYYLYQYFKALSMSVFSPGKIFQCISSRYVHSRHVWRVQECAERGFLNVYMVSSVPQRYNNVRHTHSLFCYEFSRTLTTFLELCNSRCTSRQKLTTVVFVSAIGTVLNAIAVCCCWQTGSVGAQETFTLSPLWKQKLQF